MEEPPQALVCLAPGRLYKVIGRHVISDDRAGLLPAMVAPVGPQQAEELRSLELGGVGRASGREARAGVRPRVPHVAGEDGAQLAAQDGEAREADRGVQEEVQRRRRPRDRVPRAPAASSPVGRQRLLEALLTLPVKTTQGHSKILHNTPLRFAQE